MRLAILSLTLLAAATADTPPPSPAEQSIAQARQAIEKNPKDPEGFNALSIALARRARETSDVAFYDQAQDAVSQSLALAPDNFGARKARAWVLLGKHEFVQAREIAVALNKSRPDDVQVYGFLTDSNTELGRYAEAEKACNWMLKLRPGNIPALTRAAYLREIFGDLDGALDLMMMAFRQTPVAQTEDRAWILTQMAHLKLQTGKPAEATQALRQALAIFPDYHYALANLAKVLIEESRYDDAIPLLQRRYEAAPHAENLFDLAEALRLAGRNELATKAFLEFEAKAKAESTTWDNANRELIFYYADHAKQPQKALEIAKFEASRRQDVYTLDAYAWALHINGQEDLAKANLAKALAVGVRDPKILAHAQVLGIR
jgi:tetratricopeptide (TPR) repeat protein